MITNRLIYAQIPNTEGTIFKLTGAPRGGAAVIIENFDAENQITYKFQESNDGQTWVDKQFRTVDDEVATSFIIDAGACQVIKLLMTTLHIRLRASGNADSAINISYSTSHDPAASVELST